MGRKRLFEIREGEIIIGIMKEAEFYICPYCHRHGILPMADMQCPYCKQKIDPIPIDKKKSLSFGLLILELILFIPLCILGSGFLSNRNYHYKWFYPEMQDSTASRINIITLGVAIVLGLITHRFCKRNVNLKISLIILIVLIAAIIFGFVFLTMALQSMMR
jgi:hypothetical protein